MNSRIYNGRVMHARHHPVEHKWTFPFYFYAIDLDELPELDKNVRGFGYNHWRPVSLQDRDYLQGAGTFRERLSEYIDTEKVDRIVLVTVARFFARVFNPVSFYFALDKKDQPLSVMAEVNNTFKERHFYVMEGNRTFPLNCTHDKHFHVSPFNNMDGHYEFSFSGPAKHMNIGIKLIRDNKVVMDAAMWGDGEPLTTKSLWMTILRHPFSAALTMPRILWQAALLYYKRKLPVFKKPEPSSKRTLKVNA